MNNIFTSSKSDSWSTPEWLYKQLDDEFHFELDAACTEENCKCKQGITRNNNDELTLDWYGWKAIDKDGFCKSIFCNPPYNNLGAWIQKGYEASLHGCTVVFILPTTKCDQSWWGEIVVEHAAEIRFIEGRVKFGGCKNAAPFPSCVVVFKPESHDWKISSMSKTT